MTVRLAIEPGDPAIPAHIDGSIENPRRWTEVTMDAGTSAVAHARFNDYVFSDIEDNPAPGDLDQRRGVLWDNLRSHGAPIVYQTVEGRDSDNEFFIVPRPPYQPKFGPTEYVFCEVACELQRQVQPHWTTEILRQKLVEILSVVGRDGKFDNLFAHCGYPE